jgi:hypothetical protein
MTEEERFGLPGTGGGTGKTGSVSGITAGIAAPESSPSEAYSSSEERFGLPGNVSVFGSTGICAITGGTGIGTGLDMEPETITIDIDFSSSLSEDVIIPLSSEVRFLILGRLYIDEDPAMAFDEWCWYTFYGAFARRGSDAYFRNVVKMAYTELKTATTGTDANIIPDDYTVFSEQNLVRFTDGELARLQTVASTMVAEDIVSAHVIDTGLSRVSEFSGGTLINTEGGTNTYLRVQFGSVKTVSLKMELMLVR